MSQVSSKTLSASARFKPAHTLPRRNLMGETVVIDPRVRKVFLLNPVAGTVWDQIEREATFGEICGSVVEKFQVTAERAAEDVAKFIDELCVSGLAEASPSESTAP